MKAGFVSLGCAKNLIDTEVMLGLLQESGIEVSQNPAEADILIVNTCAFIESAKEEAITTVLSMAEYKTTGIGKCRALIVAGCLSQRFGNELLEELPEADAIIGTGACCRIMEAVEEALAGRRVVLVGEDTLLYSADTPRIVTTPAYTAYLKIAEGCNNRCAFCAIPLIRGQLRSRSIEDVVKEAERLAQKGVREIILLAQDTASYGTDLYGKPKLAQLLQSLCRIEKLDWIRVLYSYPRFFNDELIETIAREPKVVKYVDLPLQHGDDTVLRNMRRPDTNEGMRALIKKLREKIPGVAIRSTFIVGFPGETEEQYQTLRKFVEEMRFDKLGVFTYSREEGTPAYDLPDQVAEAVMEERYHDLMALQAKISEEINQSLVGREFDFLVEGRDIDDDGREKNVVYGRSYREAPDVDGSVYLEGDEASSPGHIIRVRAVAGFAYDVVAERVHE